MESDEKHKLTKVYRRLPVDTPQFSDKDTANTDSEQNRNRVD